MTPEQRIRQRQIDRGEEEPERRRSTRPLARPRLGGGSAWRKTPRGWVRVDGQTWPLRPPAALAVELVRLDRLIPCRVPVTRAPVPSYAVRRVWKEGATSALRVVASVASLERRAETYARDARVRASAAFAASKTREMAERQRGRIAALPVWVCWRGVLVGRGVAG